MPRDVSKDANSLTVVMLKELLQSRGLSTSGVKAELIARLYDFDPSGEWIPIASNDDTRNQDADDQTNASYAGTSDETERNRREATHNQREMDLLRRERVIMEKELEIMRRELALVRNVQQTIVSEQEQPTVQSPHSRVSVKSVAELLSVFDGKSEDFPGWSMQVKALQATYKLNDDETRILMGMRLRGKALEWMHSRPEFLEANMNDLMERFENMFYHRPSKLILRKQFQDRVWKRDELFTDYYHDKIIKANRVPIEDHLELIDYLVEGIPDPTLRNQARMQCFDRPESLLRAFEKVTLSSLNHGDKTRGKLLKQMTSMSADGNEKADGKMQGKDVSTCYNCGEEGHLSRNCPSRERGLKCFRCGEHGHISSACPMREGKETVRSINIVVEPSTQKSCKTVRLNNSILMALVDTGSDLTLMKAESYIKIGAPRLQNSDVKFRGIGSNSIKTLGKFVTNIFIDEHCYSIVVYVVSDILLKYDLLLGTDFLNTVKITRVNGVVLFEKLEEECTVDDNISEIYHIVSEQHHNDVELQHINDPVIREKVRGIIDDYIPRKTREVDIKMTIILKDDKPIYQRARRLAQAEKDIVNTQVDEWLRDNIIQPSLSEYTSPIVLVKKKDGSARLCVDYRKINAVIVKDRYPLPLVEDQLDALQGAKLYSTLDLKNGFFHVSISEESRKYTSFIVPDGQYEFLRVPFGLCNSPAVFVRFVNAVFRDLINQKIVLAYMDDLIIPTNDFETGIRNLETVLSVAKEFGLVINWKKCALLQTEVEFLGHVIKDGSVRPSERKVDAVAKFPEPTSAKQVQSFLGLTGYFRKYVAGYSLIARPLTDLLRANVNFKFADKEVRAFETLKARLCEKPVLKLYRSDAETELHTDASMFGFGAILMQRHASDGEMHPIYYASGKTTPAESRYTSYELEVLAVVKSLKKFRTYLLELCFKIVTDCKAFSLTMNKRDLCVRVARWALLLEEFNYIIEHRPGSRMTHVDALSRNPLPMCLRITEDGDNMTARIRKAQQDDEKVRRIFELAEQQMIDGYVTRNGLLYKILNDDILLVVPKTLQSQLIRQVHGNGHFSVGKTEMLLKRDYWFQGLRSKVEKTISNCLDCILAERKMGKQEGFLNPIVKGEVPLDTYHIDHLGPLPATKKNYRHIFVIVDAFSKFVWLYTTKTTSTSEVLTHLNKQAITFGNPRRIISDRGTAFTSAEFQEYCAQEKIEHSLIATGVPRGNGQVERVNRTLIPLLTKLSSPQPGNWYRYLGSAQRYLNATPHRSINTTPFQLFFGTRMRFKDDQQIRELLEQEWATMFEEGRNEVRAKAKESIMKIQLENMKNFNRKRKKPRLYCEDDLVAIKRTQSGPGLKLASKYFGPYRIIKTLRHNRYTVEKVGNHEGPYQTTTVVDFMKPWVEENSDEDDEETDKDEDVSGAASEGRC